MDMTRGRAGGELAIDLDYEASGPPAGASRKVAKDQNCDDK